MVSGLLALSACTSGSAAAPQVESAGHALHAQLVPWGDGAQALSHVRGGGEQAPSGPQAIALDAGGQVLILDGAKRRIVRLLADGGLQPVVTDLPSDADGFAIAGDELAVHRALSLQVPLYTLQGRPSGVVPVPEGAREADRVQLLPGGRVVLEHGYQLRYLLGSPNAPRQAAAVLAQPREGAGEGFEREGLLVTLARVDGEPLDEPATPARGGGRFVPALARAGAHVLLHRVQPAKDPADQGGVRELVLDLGEADAGRVIGRRGDRACVLLETVDRTAAEMSVHRELVWVELAPGKVLARWPAPVSDVYSPRQEFAFDGARIAQAWPTEAGLAVRVIDVKSALVQEVAK